MAFPASVLDLTLPEPSRLPSQFLGFFHPLPLAPGCHSSLLLSLISYLPPFLTVFPKSGSTPRPRTLTICALRYICAWLAVKAGEDVLPKSTACWARPEAVAELTLWARLMSCAAVGEAARLS